MYSQQQLYIYIYGAYICIYSCKVNCSVTAGYLKIKNEGLQHISLTSKTAPQYLFYELLDKYLRLQFRDNV